MIHLILKGFIIKSMVGWKMTEVLDILEGTVVDQLKKFHDTLKSK